MPGIRGIPQRIVRDFGGKSEPAREGVRALAEAIGGDPASLVQTSLEQWTAFFRKTCGQDWGTQYRHGPRPAWIGWRGTTALRTTRRGPRSCCSPCNPGTCFW